MKLNKRCALFSLTMPNKYQLEEYQILETKKPAI